MSKFENNFPKYVAKVFKERLKELGLSQYRFLNDNVEFTNRPTLTNILRSAHGTNISTLAHYADLLGMEIIIRPKQTEDEDKD